MSNKNLPKFAVAFGVLAMLLIFLGANYVPRISAFSSAKENTLYAANFAGSDYFERHPSAVANPMNYAGSDWIERHPPAAANPVNFDNSDWFERHPSNYYSNSDWIERHPEQSNR